jgi:hypothetical protein
MVDKEKVKKALDDFENEKFSNASDILRGEIKNSVNTFLKDKLSLKNDPIEIKEE